MDRGSNKKSPKVDEQMKGETEALERSGKAPHVEEFRASEDEGDAGAGHRISGSGTSTDEYPWKDHGEVGGESHPKPKDLNEQTDRS